MLRVMDGNDAVAYSSYAFTEAAVIYPITPSSGIAERIEAWSNEENKLNIFEQPVNIIEMQSESGVAGAMHGLLKTGTLAASYTSSQGLLLMEPALYKMVGEQLPGVIHVAARSVSTSALSIYGDHSDVMSVRQTGAIMLSSSSVQEAALLAAVSHLTAIDVSIPVIHFFDGFNTSHELRKIELPTYQQLKAVFNDKAYQVIKENSIRNDHPRASGASETPDLFFQQQETSNQKYEGISEKTRQYMSELNGLFGTSCSTVDYYGDPHAEVVLVAMGSVCQTIHQVVDEQNARGKKFGLITIHLYRPFPTTDFLNKLPQTVKTIVILDRTKEPGSVSEPLLSDVKSVCYELNNHPTILGGRYGLGSKDVTPDQIRSAFFEGEKKAPRKTFTLGIIDDVTHLSIPGTGTKDLTDPDAFQMKTWGFGSDGAVSCNKQTAKIIGESSDWQVQGLFWYDPKKSGNLTISHLRFSKQPIYSAYHVQKLQAVSCYCERYVKRYDLLKGLQQNGVFLLNTDCTDEQLDTLLPNDKKKYIAEHNINFYKVSANRIAAKFNLGPHVNTIMQTCFLYLSKLIPFEKSIHLLKNEISDNLASISEKTVKNNFQAIDCALDHLQKVEVPESWNQLPDHVPSNTSKDLPDYYMDIQTMMNQQKGDQITVGTLLQNKLTNGSFPTGTSEKDKRDIATQIPIWNPDHCIECNLCATVCPHAAIRPFLLLKGDDQHAPFTTKKERTCSNLNYRLQVSPLDCTGCSLCADICPAKNKALEMRPIESKRDEEAQNWDYVMNHHYYPDQQSPLATSTLRNSQFQKPLLEFPGACAGCGQTAYVKLLTQLFGSQLVIANATGCSSIWGCTAPSVPYTKNENGFGPVWGTSLLENNAEYGFGMQSGADLAQRHLADRLTRLERQEKYSSAFRKAIGRWLSAYKTNTHDEKATEPLIAATLNEMEIHPELESIFSLRHFMTKRSHWLIGGDGWAYDIDSSGIDHILSQGANVNILILDNEGYSNTGGQTSKASPTGSRTKFASTGNQKVKKDFASAIMTYENVYVAQVCIGAHPNQTLKAFKEANEYNGPSVIIAYSPCILHGISYNSSVIEEKKAVQCGYWALFRRYPETSSAACRMKIDSKEPNWALFEDFLAGENRFSYQAKKNEDAFAHLLQRNKVEAQKRYRKYLALTNV